MASDPDAKQTAKPTFFLRDMEETRKVFNRFDTNADGMISENELDNVLKGLGFEATAEDIHRVMVDVDTDNDGFINLEEFTAFCNGGGDADKDLRDAFDLYDQDSDGLISSSELHQVLTRLGQSCSIDDCAKMISSVDSDHDGHVSFEEFKKMMTPNGSA